MNEESELIEIKDRQVCKISNQLVEAKYKLTLEEQRLILLTIAQVDVDDEDFKTYKIDLKNLENKVDKKINKNRMKSLAFNIMKKPFMLKETNAVYNFFAKVEPIETESALKVQFHPDLKPFLLDLQKEFTKYSLNFLLNLQSIYAVRLYQLLKQYQTIGKRKFNVDELREILQVPKSYDNFADFKRKVLNIAQKEINKKTDIKISWEVTKKVRRKIVEIEFSVIGENNNSINDKRSSKEVQIQKVNSKIATKQEKALKNDLSTIDDFKLFRTKILKEYRNKVFVLNNDVFSIKGVYLALDDKMLKPDVALEKWHLLFENRDKIQVLVKEDYEKQQAKKIEELQHKIESIKEKTFYQVIDYEEFKDEFEFKVLQINKIIILNKEIDVIDFQVKLVQNKIDVSKDIEINVMFEMVEDKNFRFNVKEKIDFFYNYDKFSLDMDSQKFKWLK